MTSTTGVGINAISGFVPNVNPVETDLTIDSSAGSVSGGSGGIVSLSYGAGDTNIVTADVTSATGDAINSRAASNTGSLMVDTTAGTVSGGASGVNVSTTGRGVLNITVADVGGANGYGITARKSGGGGDLTIDTTAGSVTSTDQGVRAGIYDGGSLNITTADVTSMDSFGVSAQNYGDDVNVDTTAGSVTAYDTGVIISNYSYYGALNVTTADVTGITGNGLRAFNYGAYILV